MNQLAKPISSAMKECNRTVELWADYSEILGLRCRQTSYNFILNKWVGSVLREQMRATEFGLKLRNDELLSHLAMIAIFLLPAIYLLIDPTYFNKDDNFAQFTPAIDYAIQALMSGLFPWLSPADFTVRLAEAPYYAIFSPLMLVAGFTKNFLGLAPYWIMSIWAVLHHLFINWVLLRFTRSIAIPWHLRVTVILCAGFASFFALWSASWYYTLPYHLLLITKIMYWHQVSIGKRRDEAVHLVVTFLAVLGGNPQFLLYTLIAEFLIVATMMSRKTIEIYVRNSLLTGLMMLPLFYCHIRYWSGGWRTIEIFNTIDVLKFLRVGLVNPLVNEGQSIWVILCAACIWRPVPRLVKALAGGALAFLLLSSVDPRSISSIGLNILTVPLKWWFFGGVMAVCAVALWAEQWNAKTQSALSVFALLSGVLYLTHYFGDTPFSWMQDDYSAAQRMSQIIVKFAPSNSRTLQLSGDRPIGPEPSKNLILNTWLTTGAFMTTGYESLQHRDTLRRTIVPEPKILQDLGVGAVWINKNDVLVAQIDLAMFNVVYSDHDNMLAVLHEPGRIVSCKNVCAPKVSIYADRINVSFNSPETGPVKMKVNALAGMVVSSEKSTHLASGREDGWVTFDADGSSTFELRYRDDWFLCAIGICYLVALTLMALLLISKKRSV